MGFKTYGLRERAMQRKYNDKFSRSVKGIVGKMWNTLTWRIQNRSGRCPSYANVELRITRAEFVNWSIPRVIRWLEKHPGERPTIDRKIVPGHYELSNLRLATKSDNSRRTARTRYLTASPGMAWCTGCQDYLEVNAFGRNASTKTGRHHYCKNCRKQKEKS